MEQCENVSVWDGHSKVPARVTRIIKDVNAVCTRLVWVHTRVVNHVKGLVNLKWAQSTQAGIVPCCQRRADLHGQRCNFVVVTRDVAGFAGDGTEESTWLSLSTVLDSFQCWSFVAISCTPLALHGASSNLWGEVPTCFTLLPV